jgi:SAM-dependent methyltransferase
MMDFSVKFPPDILDFYQSKKPQIGGPAIAERARLRAELDFKELTPWLPSTIASYVNIGCGQGLLDVFMARTFTPSGALLIDGGDAEKEVGFKESITPWTNIEHTKAILTWNVPDAQFDFAEPNKPFDFDADIVLSLRSWGHHYPISTYLPSVKKALAAGGMLIVDIRKDTDGRKQLERDFKFVGIIGGSPKRDRMVFTA